MHLGELIRMLQKHIGKGKNDVDFTVEFVRNLMEEPATKEDDDLEENEKYYPFYDASNSSNISRLLNNGYLSDTNAGKILSNIADEKFTNWINYTDDAPKMDLINELNEYGFNCNKSTVGRRCLTIIKQMLNCQNTTRKIDIGIIPVVALSQRGAYIKNINTTDIETYLKNANEKYNVIRTLLYKNEDKKFYDIYVCNEILMNRNKTKDDRSLIVYDNFSTNDIKKINKNLIIKGTGGLGKSMMMRHIFLNAIKTYKENNLIPVIINIRDYVPNKRNLSTLFDTEIRGLSINFFNNEYSKLRSTGNILYLLDGLDEVSPEYRNDFNFELEHFIDENSNNIFIMSTRELKDYSEYQRFTFVGLAPLEIEQSIELINKLEYRENQPEFKENFIKLISTKLHYSHSEFIENPLLLTIMLMIYDAYGEIPTQLYQFYEKAYNVLSIEHDAFKGLSRQFKTGLSAEKLKDFIAEFCARTYDESKYEFTNEELIEWINKTDFVKENEVSAYDLKTDMISGLCLMYEESLKIFFSHRSFQEYFTAYYFYKQDDIKLKKLAKKYDSTRKTFDKVFSMLYDMNSKRMEHALFFPYLQEKIARWNNNYKDFLIDSYGDIRFGDYDAIDDSDTNYPVLNFIINVKKIEKRTFFDDLDDTINASSTQYYRIKSNYFTNDDPDDWDVVDEDSIPDDYPHDKWPPEELGYEYTLEFDEIFDEQEKNYETITNDNYPLKKQFNQLIKYCKHLETIIKNEQDNESLF